MNDHSLIGRLQQKLSFSGLCFEVGHITRKPPQTWRHGASKLLLPSLPSPPLLSPQPSTLTNSLTPHTSQSCKEQQENMADKSTTMPANSLSSLINSVRSFATRNPSPDLGDAAPPEDPPSTPPHQQPHPDLQSPQSSILASVRAEMQAHVQELQQEEEQTPDEDTEMQMDPKKQDHHYQIAREDGDEVLQEWPNNPFVSPLRRSFQTYSIGKRKVDPHNGPKVLMKPPADKTTKVSPSYHLPPHRLGSLRHPRQPF